MLMRSGQRGLLSLRTVWCTPSTRCISGAFIRGVQSSSAGPAWQHSSVIHNGNMYNNNKNKNTTLTTSSSGGASLLTVRRTFANRTGERETQSQQQQSQREEESRIETKRGEENKDERKEEQSEKEQTWWEWYTSEKEYPKHSTKWWLDKLLICFIFAVTGSTAVLIARPLAQKLLGEGSLMEGPWSWRVGYFLVMTPSYSACLVFFGTLFGRQAYMLKVVQRMWGRFLPFLFKKK